MAPRASAASAASRSQSATLETSAWKGAARPPASTISCATASALSRAVCATTAITAPSAPKRRAMLAPIPREPPVTIATLPSSFMPCLLSFEAGTIACVAPPEWQTWGELGRQARTARLRRARSA